MRFSANHRGTGRRLTMIAAAGVLAISLTGCSSLLGGDDDSADDAPAGAGSAFSQALSKDYIDLAGQASTLPTDPSEEKGFFASLNPFSSSPASSSELLAKAFTSKADMADSGTDPDAEAAANPAQTQVRARLVRAVAAGKAQFPEQAARAQADYDCWVLYGAVASAAAASQACKSALDGSLTRLEAAAQPAPAPVTAPAPAPVTSAPAPAPVAAATSDFTVYFDFDSWTLKAEQLKVMTNVIETARAGKQSKITVVGHTDTSGSDAYNQKLSVKRANVVVEALVDMGARRASIRASGVGKNDLAVQTGDNVKEAKNRRTVITLLP